MILVQNHQQQLSGSNRFDATIRVTSDGPSRDEGTIEGRETNKMEGVSEGWKVQ